MVNHPMKERREGIPKLDESWWSSLLSEEERYLSSRLNAHSVDGTGEFHSNQIHNNGRPVGVDWERIETLFSKDETIILEVTGYNRGGLLVEGDAVHGFVPISHLVNVSCEVLEDERDQILADYVGRTLHLKVIECEPARGRIVFSERAALASAGRRNQLLDELIPSDCVRGIVTNITDFGIFIDLGGVEGLVHVSEISWGRVRHPGDAVAVGQEVTAYIINVDKDKARIALSLKRLCSNPWEDAENRYHIGQIVQAIVTSVVPFGAFARLEEGLDGLIHVTEMSESGSVVPAEILGEGQPVTVRILHIDAGRQRLGLSLIHTG
jgi:small subunit ribosomal protein S1